MPIHCSLETTPRLRRGFSYTVDAPSMGINQETCSNAHPAISSLRGALRVFLVLNVWIITIDCTRHLFKFGRRQGRATVTGKSWFRHCVRIIQIGRGRRRFSCVSKSRSKTRDSSVKTK
jgi:hypothetical protein